MIVTELFRSFLPLHNPIGFGAADFVEIAFFLSMAAILVIVYGSAAVAGQRFAARTGWCMGLLGVTPIVLRLLLIWRHPIPTPLVSDDFSYLLAADTLLHFRFANPTHPMYRFFETFFVLQEPSYSSIFPLGSAFFLELGKILTGSNWAGVALTTGALAALTYWMLRAWIAPIWALAGGFLAVAAFGPLSQWMNSFWGGAVSGCAGCLVFGAVPRLKASPYAAWILGSGIAVQVLTRPFESVLLVIAIGFYFLVVQRPSRTILAALVPVGAALGITLLHNWSVTGSMTTLPYALSRYQYGVPATFTFQPTALPHRSLTPQQQMDYEIQAAVHGPSTDSFSSFVARWASRMRFYRFFLLAPLYLALPFAILILRRREFLWAAATIFVFSLGTTFYPYFYTHYVAAIACLLILFSVAGLERLSRITIRTQPVGRSAAIILAALAGSHFIFWYALHLTARDAVFYAAIQYESWDAINRDDPEGRIAIRARLLQSPGQQLVFVRYSPGHQFEEWVHNDADIDKSRIVWARDLGAGENAKLTGYYARRTAWLLEPDLHPPKLTTYSATASNTNEPQPANP